jgi:hypothetical protein
MAAARLSGAAASSKEGHQSPVARPPLFGLPWSRQGALQAIRGGAYHVRTSRARQVFGPTNRAHRPALDRKCVSQVRVTRALSDPGAPQLPEQAWSSIVSLQAPL